MEKKKIDDSDGGVEMTEAAGVVDSDALDEGVDHSDSPSPALSGDNDGSRNSIDNNNNHSRYDKSHRDTNRESDQAELTAAGENAPPSSSSQISSPSEEISFIVEVALAALKFGSIAFKVENLVQNLLDRFQYQGHVIITNTDFIFTVFHDRLFDVNREEDDHAGDRERQALIDIHHHHHHHNENDYDDTDGGRNDRSFSAQDRFSVRSLDPTRVRRTRDNDIWRLPYTITVSLPSGGSDFARLDQLSDICQDLLKQLQQLQRQPRLCQQQPQQQERDAPEMQQAFEIHSTDSHVTPCGNVTQYGNGKENDDAGQCVEGRATALSASTEGITTTTIAMEGRLKVRQIQDGPPTWSLRTRGMAYIGTSLGFVPILRGSWTDFGCTLAGSVMAFMTTAVFDHYGILRPVPVIGRCDLCRIFGSTMGRTTYCMFLVAFWPSVLAALVDQYSRRTVSLTVITVSSVISEVPGFMILKVIAELIHRNVLAALSHLVESLLICLWLAFGSVCGYYVVLTFDDTDDSDQASVDSSYTPIDSLWFVLFSPLLGFCFSIFFLVGRSQLVASTLVSCVAVGMSLLGPYFSSPNICSLVAGMPLSPQLSPRHGPGDGSIAYCI